MSITYTCYFFDGNRKISGSKGLLADNEAGAIAAARALAGVRNAAAFEVWQATRHVYSEG